MEMQMSDFKLARNHRLEYANSFQLAGPSSDGMMHLMFVRDVYRGTKVESTPNHAYSVKGEGFVANAFRSQTEVEVITTIVFPAERLGALAEVLAKVADAVFANESQDEQDETEN